MWINQAQIVETGAYLLHPFFRTQKQCWELQPNIFYERLAGFIFFSQNINAWVGICQEINFLRLF